MANKAASEPARGDAAKPSGRAAKNGARRLLMPFRLVGQRPRLSIAMAAAAIFGLLLPWDWRVMPRALLAWDFGVALFLVMAAVLFLRHDVESIRQRANLEDEGRTAILLLTAIAALASLGAIVVELGGGHGQPASAARVALGLSTIVLSWFFVHVIFTLHYAHSYYTKGPKQGATPGAAGGLDFPGDDDPDYWDFLYFSLVLGMTFQVSDVGITSKDLRRVATAHGVVSFFFNTALIALTVNIAASEM